MTTILSNQIGALLVEFSEGSSYTGGFIGQLTLTNTGVTTVTGWSLVLEAGFDINSLWNGELVELGDGLYQITEPAWLSGIESGDSFTIGFDAMGSSQDVVGINDAEGIGLSVVDLLAGPPVMEGDDALFTLTLREAATEEVTVSFETGAGSASAGADYVTKSGTVTFQPGDTEAVVTVQTIDDTLIEPDETVSLNLTGATGAVLGTSTANTTLTSDDVPVLQAAPVIIEEGNTLEVPVSSLSPLSTDGNRIVDDEGNPVVLAGVNWFGMETTRFAPDGLNVREWRSMMDQMMELGFNMIRIPFSNAALEGGRIPTSINYAINPDLEGLTSIEVLDKIVDYAGEIGLRILLDNHRSSAGDGPEGNGLWYTAAYSEDQWTADWVALAERYADAPAIIGADLRNEPHSASWGDGGERDWAAAAERAGNAILATGSEWLIVVEGVQVYNDDYYWWGGNLQGVADRPVVLTSDDKLVYSPHAYSPEIFEQPWFSAPNYPDNLPAIWDKQFGYIHDENIAPILVGEFGNRYADIRNQQWLNKFVAYLAGDFDGDGNNDLQPGETGLSWAYWAWNPNSGDTGGILDDDWQTAFVDTKIAALAPSLDTATVFDPNAGGETIIIGEDRVVEIALSLSETAFAPVTVMWTTVDGTAKAGIDYVAASGTETFAPGDPAETIEVTILGDTVAEPEEMFQVLFTAVDGATLEAESVEITIQDTDPAAPSDQLIGAVQRVDGLTDVSQTVSYQDGAEFERPVVFALATLNGGDPSTVAFSDVSADGATLRIEEANYLDGRHWAAEEVTLLTLEEGRWDLGDGSILEVGTIATGTVTREGFETVTFSQAFDETPVILVQVQTDVGGQWEVVRARNVTTTGFEVALQEQESLSQTGHVVETIGWAALDAHLASGLIDWNGITAQAFSTGDTVTHDGTTPGNGFTFNADLGSDPLIAAVLASYDGPDTANLRLKGVSANGSAASARFVAHEERSLDSEIWHTTETVTGIAFEQAGLLAGTDVLIG